MSKSAGRWGIDRRAIFQALKVGAVVGTVLLVINQYDSLFGGGTLRVLPAILTYCVPVLVYLGGRYSRSNHGASD